MNTPMKSIMENPLVLKYFGCQQHHGKDAYCVICCGDEGLALRILKAMEEPLNTWDLYLSVNSGVKVLTWENPGITDIHAHMWKLPDDFQNKCPLKRCNGACIDQPECTACKNNAAHCSCYQFQPKKECEKKETYPECRCEHCNCHKKPDAVERLCPDCGVTHFDCVPPTSEVEERIHSIALWALEGPLRCSMEGLQKEIRDLCDLVRKEKK